MNHGKLKLLTLGILGCILFSCSPAYRFNRLVEKYPFLLERKTYDSIRIVEFNSTDSIFYWDEIHDTITINGVRLERFRDSFFRVTTTPCPRCTTFIQRNVYQPRQETKEKDKEKGMTFWLKAMIVYMIINTLLILLKK